MLTQFKDQQSGIHLFTTFQSKNISLESILLITNARNLEICKQNFPIFQLCNFFVFPLGFLIYFITLIEPDSINIMNMMPILELICCLNWDPQEIQS